MELRPTAACALSALLHVRAVLNSIYATPAPPACAVECVAWDTSVGSWCSSTSVERSVQVEVSTVVYVVHV